jgi:hypothetical protein
MSILFHTYDRQKKSPDSKAIKEIKAKKIKCKKCHRAIGTAYYHGKCYCSSCYFELQKEARLGHWRKDVKK